jgi:hypothetical protein
MSFNNVITNFKFTSFIPDRRNTKWIKEAHDTKRRWKHIHWSIKNKCIDHMFLLLPYTSSQYRKKIYGLKRKQILRKNI